MDQTRSARANSLVPTAGPTLHGKDVNATSKQGGISRRQMGLVFPGAFVALHHLLSFDSAQSTSNALSSCLQLGLSPHETQSFAHDSRPADDTQWHSQGLCLTAIEPRRRPDPWPTCHRRTPCGKTPHAYYSIEKQTVQHPVSRPIGRVCLNFLGDLGRGSKPPFPNEGSSEFRTEY